MGIPYTKPALSFEAQLTQLESRGMVVKNKEQALRFLAAVSYYRLSAYWYPFRNPGHTPRTRIDTFRAGTTFEKVIELYELDRHLRLEILDAVERIEINLRTSLTYHMTRTHGPFAHTDHANFEPSFQHDEWLNGINIEARRSRDEFIRHYSEKYEGFPKLPLWMCTEVFSFGALSKMLKYVKEPMCREVAKTYDIQPKVLESWVHSLSVLRNICAHHGRLWNRMFGVSPAIPKHPTFGIRWDVAKEQSQRLFMVLLVLRHMLAVHHDGSAWAARVEKLLMDAGDATSPWVLPEAWTTHRVWKRS